MCLWFAAPNFRWTARDGNIKESTVANSSPPWKCERRVAHSASNPRKDTEKWKIFWKILSFSYLFCIFWEVTIVLVAWSLLVSTHSSVSGQAPQSPPGVLTAGTQATLPRSGFVKTNRWYRMCTVLPILLCVCTYEYLCMCFILICSLRK